MRGREVKGSKRGWYDWRECMRGKACMERGRDMYEREGEGEREKREYRGEREGDSNVMER